MRRIIIVGGGASGVLLAVHLLRNRPDGLIVVPLCAGVGHTVEVRYRTTADQWTGMGVSAATLIALAGIHRRRRSGIMGHPS